MVRQADYIYGVVPPRGEYGFERKPAQDDPAVLSRVQSISTTFQWAATASNDAEAIAVDRGDPPLVVRIITDPRDPDGRRSVCMHIWVASRSESTAHMIAQIWPSKVALAISLDEFLLSSKTKASGRIVVGPGNSFTAVGFDQTWGTRTTNSHPESRPSSGMTARVNPATSARNLHNSKSSSFPLKAFATLCAIASVAAAGIGVMLYSDVERDVQKLTRELKDANIAIRQITSENEKQKKKVHLLQTEVEQLQKLNANLNKVVADNPEKADQVELLQLRSFKATVETFIDTQNDSLKKLADAVPSP